MEERRKKISCTNGIVGGLGMVSFTLFDTGQSIEGQVNEIEEGVDGCFQYQICVSEFFHK